MRVFLALTDVAREAYLPHLRRALPGMELTTDPAMAEAVIYAPSGPISDFTPFKRAKIVQSLWAGVERVVGNPTLTQPLCRMVDPGLTQGMVEWCAGWTLRHHLRMDDYAQDGVWRNGQVPPLATSRRVSVLGTGALGAAVARALAGLGFDVAGWSASGHAIDDGIAVMGGDALPQALARADILICLLPDTSQTRGLINATTLALLPQGAVLLNPGRGTLIDEGALLAALETGRVGHAVLDVFQTEPLPPGHPFWVHPRVTVTPHIAAETRPETAALLVADNLRRARDGQPLLHLVDRAKGY